MDSLLSSVGMKWIIALALVGACVAYQKETMLVNNRIPLDKAVVTGQSTCEECQSLVKRFVLAAHDEKKMAELKIVLKMLCQSSGHYKEECELFANSIDTILKRLEPYLSDYHRVCKSFHMCSNSRIDAFRRIGMLYVKHTIDRVEGMKDLVCDECQFAASELKTLVEDKEQQKAIREFFSNEICVHAGSHRGMCDMLVEQFLPELFQELDAVLADPKKACADVGFCAAQGKSAKLTALPAAKSSVHPLLAFWEKAKTLKTTKGTILMSCLECKVSVDSLLLEMEDQRDALSKDFQDLVCLHVLPANFTPSCEDFMSMYLPTVMFMTIKQFSGEGICTKMHTCDMLSLSRMAALPKTEAEQLSCAACKGLQSYVKDAVTLPEVQHNAVAGLQARTCDYMPRMVQPMCDSVVANLVPRVLNKSSLLAAKGAFCDKIKQKC